MLTFMNCILRLGRIALHAATFIVATTWMTCAAFTDLLEKILKWLEEFEGPQTQLL